MEKQRETGSRKNLKIISRLIKPELYKVLLVIAKNPPKPLNKPTKLNKTKQIQKTNSK